MSNGCPKIVIIRERGTIVKVLTANAEADVAIVDLDREDVSADNADILGMANENCYEEAYII